MAEFSFNAYLKMAAATMAAIDGATLDNADTGLRPHLGASQIGKKCERALWYSFHWCKESAFPARVLRLFARGQREEDVLAGLLREAGVTVHQVDASTGQQFSFRAIGGHFGGSMDGACIGLPDAPKSWHVLEFKTHNRKSFSDLQSRGVELSKPEHFAQMQCYMMWTGMTRALYMAACKDSDDLHLERVDYDAEVAHKMLEKAQRVINAPKPPECIGDATWYECKMCDYRDVCHGTDAPMVNCRTCTHSTAEADGSWTCARHSTAIKEHASGQHVGLYAPDGAWIKWLPQSERPAQVGMTAWPVSVSRQREGCIAHRYNPHLLHWADWVEADEAANTLTYIMDGRRFTNGERPNGYSSHEILACQDKAALGAFAENRFVRDLRQQFDAEVVK